MRLSNSLADCPFLPASYLQTFAFLEQSGWRCPTANP